MNTTLSPRERQTLELIVEGLTTREIAERLGISLGTAQHFMMNIFAKLNVDNRTKAAVKALREGLVQ